MSINKAILIGNLGSDPEVKELNGGKKVATFSLATSETFKDRTSGERKSNTTWHNVVVWNALAEIAGRYLTKGSKIYLEGKINHRSFESGNGEKKYITEIIGNTLTMLGDKTREAQTHVIESSGTTLGNATSDDLPF
jgi:single-strand DNA-binding protein